MRLNPTGRCLRWRIKRYRAPSFAGKNKAKTERVEQWARSPSARRTDSKASLGCSNCETLGKEENRRLFSPEIFSAGFENPPVCRRRTRPLICIGQLTRERAFSAKALASQDAALRHHGQLESAARYLLNR